jgi:hypothetical protein
VEKSAVGTRLRKCATHTDKNGSEVAIWMVKKKEKIMANEESTCGSKLRKTSNQIKQDSIIAILSD